MIKEECLYSYYGSGRLYGNKPKKGLVYMLLDDHVNKIIVKQSDIFKAECKLAIDELKNSYKEQFSQVKNEIKKIKTLIKEEKDKVKKEKEKELELENIKRKIELS